MDEDLKHMSIEQLQQEIMKLRNGIRSHRDNSGHDLCWFVPELWSLVPENANVLPKVPETCEFLENCKKYRESLDGNKNKD